MREEFSSLRNNSYDVIALTLNQPDFSDYFEIVLSDSLL